MSFAKERLFSFAIVLSIGFLARSLARDKRLDRGPRRTIFLAAAGAGNSLTSVNSLISFVVIAGLFAAIYKLLPDVVIEWRDVILGGIATSLLFTVGKLFLALYLGKASFASTYGAFASVVVLVLWVYYSGQIFFFGAELTKSFANRYGSHPSLHPGRLVDRA